MRKIDIDSIPSKVLILNLYLTQFISLMVSLLLYYIIYRQNPLKALYLFSLNHLLSSFVYGFSFAIIIVILNVLLSRVFPKEAIDDGGINEKLFKDLPIWHIALITLVVGFIEELLFRGVIQSSLGVILTSILFTLIHFRYLKKVILIIVTFLTSLGLGYIAANIGLFSAFIAHFFIDFILGVFIRKKWFLKF